MNFDQLIKFAVEQGASDLHFQTGAAPLLRINGQIRNVESPPAHRRGHAPVHPVAASQDDSRGAGREARRGAGFLVLRSRTVPVPGATSTATWERRRWSCGSSS